MMYNNQFDYDNASEPSLSDYREPPKFADFCEWVALELLSNRNCCGIDHNIFYVDLMQTGGGFTKATEMVEERVTEKQFTDGLGEL